MPEVPAATVKPLGSAGSASAGWVRAESAPVESALAALAQSASAARPRPPPAAFPAASARGSEFEDDTERLRRAELDRRSRATQRDAIRAQQRFGRREIADAKPIGGEIRSVGSRGRAPGEARRESAGIEHR